MRSNSFLCHTAKMPRTRLGSELPVHRVRSALIVVILAMMAVVMAIVAVTMVIVRMIMIDAHHGAVITVVVMLIVHGGTVMMVSIVMIVIHTDADAPWPNIKVLGKRGGWSCDRKTKNQGEWSKVFHFEPPRAYRET
ncbi:hypothetical protein BBta_p0237 (plasmid) [Bradyrhizobium sp. BTAi1]|nr:hypothetical protein BBta_p0237 [Bradyrhizobium sp. BTAi1]